MSSCMSRIAGIWGANGEGGPSVRPLNNLSLDKVLRRRFCELVLNWVRVA